MKRALPFIIVTAVGLMTLAGGFGLYRAKRAPALRAIDVDHSGSDHTDDSGLHIRGSGKATVTLEEFGDFQCPPCGALAGVLEQIERDYGTALRVIFREFPLAMHQHARVAALAAESAGLQGRFWPMHDMLYREQAEWSKSADPQGLFFRYASKLGLNVERFKMDMAGAETAARLASAQKRAQELNVNETPSVFINDHRIDAKSFNVADLHKAIDSAKNEKTTH